jgi:hypothetical protein
VSWVQSDSTTCLSVVTSFNSDRTSLVTAGPLRVILVSPPLYPIDQRSAPTRINTSCSNDSSSCAAFVPERPPVRFGLRRQPG